MQKYGPLDLLLTTLNNNTKMTRNTEHRHCETNGLVLLTEQGTLLGTLAKNEF